MVSKIILVLNSGRRLQPLLLPSTRHVSLDKLLSEGLTEYADQFTSPAE